MFIRDAATCTHFCCTLCDLVTLSLQPRHDQRASAAAVLFMHSQPWRICHASASLLTWFKCSPKVGVALLDSRTNSERFYSHLIYLLSSTTTATGALV